MIPNVVKGGDMRGLVRYLVGPGRSNEHTSPHVVAGSPFVVAWHGNEVLNREAGAEVSDFLEEPRRRYDVQMHGQVTEQDPDTGEKRVIGWQKRDTWHCSLSVSGEEGPLSEEQWESIAQDFMDEMEFTEASGKAPCRWVAIHHGLSAEGNDHIHIAASMVREDGTKWAGQRTYDREAGRLVGDYEKAQKVCRRLEARHGLQQLDGAQHARGEKPAERARAERQDRPVGERQELEQRLRRAAVASTSEAEWIRRVRADGVVVKPRFAKGTTDVVEGYRAALKPEDRATRLHFIGGRNIAKDLSIDRVRENWPAPSIEAATEAAEEWQAAFRGQPPVHRGGRESVTIDNLARGAQGVAAENFQAFNQRLASVPIEDRQTWAEAARDGAGVLSSWARLDPDNATELREAARALGRSAQLDRRAVPPGRRVKESPMGTAMILLASDPRRGGKGKVAGAVFLRQVLKTAEAIRDHHRATANLREAQHVQRQVVDRLQRIKLIGYGSDTTTTAAEVDREGGERSQAQTAQRLARTLAPDQSPSDRSGQQQRGSDPLPPRLVPRKDTTREVESDGR